MTIRRKKKKHQNHLREITIVVYTKINEVKKRKYCVYNTYVCVCVYIYSYRSSCNQITKLLWGMSLRKINK